MNPLVKRTGRRAVLAAATLSLALLGACESLEQAMTMPEAEPLVPVEDNYVNPGPSVSAAHGNGTRTLLEEFSEEARAKDDALSQLRRTQAELEALRTERDTYENQRNTASLEIERLRGDVEMLRKVRVELEQKILALEIEQARLRRKDLQEQIVRLQRELQFEKAAVDIGVTDAGQLSLRGSGHGGGDAHGNGH